MHAAGRTAQESDVGVWQLVEQAKQAKQGEKEEERRELISSSTWCTHVRQPECEAAAVTVATAAAPLTRSAVVPASVSTLGQSGAATTG
jgi:hypothetical protein